MFMTIRKARQTVKFWERHSALNKPIPEKYKAVVDSVIELSKRKTLLERLL